MSEKTALTSYQKARLQVVGYRSIQARVNELLSEHGINTSQWIILGWLHDHPKGLRVTALAEILNVETPLITALLQPLRGAGHITLTTDPTDKRAKLARLSTAGAKLVPSLERDMMAHLSLYDRALSADEMSTYFEALERFIEVSGVSNHG